MIRKSQSSTDRMSLQYNTICLLRPKWGPQIPNNINGNNGLDWINNSIILGCYFLNLYIFLKS